MSPGGRHVSLVCRVLLRHVIGFCDLLIVRYTETEHNSEGHPCYLVGVVVEPLQEREEELVGVLLVPPSELRLGPAHPGLEV